MAVPQLPLLDPPLEDPPLLEEPNPPRLTELLPDELPEIVLPDEVTTRVESRGTVVVPPFTGCPTAPLPP